MVRPEPVGGEGHVRVPIDRRLLGASIVDDMVAADLLVCTHDDHVAGRHDLP